MHPKHYMKMAFLGLGIALLSLADGPSKGISQDKPMATFDKSGAVIVNIGGQSRFQMKTKKPIKEVFNEADRVVQVSSDAMDRSYVILLGRTAGSSKIELTDSDGTKETYLIIVQRDMELLRNLIKKTVPTAAVEVTPIGDQGNNIILTGYTAREDERDNIRQLATALGFTVSVNTVTVGGGGHVPHVQLDLTLARVDRTRARSRGASWIVNGSTVSGGSLLGGLITPQPAGAAAAAAGLGVIPGALGTAPGNLGNLIGGVVPADFQMVLAALRTEGLAKLVSAPTVVTRSGEEAELLVGQQVPVIGGAAGITGPGVTYRPVGTELRFLPVVYGNGKIHITVEPRVSAVNPTQALTFAGGTSPAFDEQRLRTSMIMEPGQTAAIGGLIQSSTQASVTKIPLLGDIPYIGALFSFATQQDQEIELVILITPRLVDPADAGQMPRQLPGSETRKPDDFEFYLETILEAPRGQRQVWDGHTYRPAWKNSNTAGTIPCADGKCATPVGTGNGAGCATPGKAGVSSVTPPAMLPPTNEVQLDNPVTPLQAPSVGLPLDPVPSAPSSVLTPTLPGEKPTARARDR